MDSVLCKIIEIERAAQGIMDKAENAAKRLPQEIEEEREKRTAALKREMKEKITAFARQEALDEQLRKEHILQSQKFSMSNLNEMFEQNSEKWEQEVFENIIGKKWR